MLATAQLPACKINYNGQSAMAKECFRCPSIVLQAFRPQMRLYNYNKGVRIIKINVKSKHECIILTMHACMNMQGEIVQIAIVMYVSGPGLA